MATRKIVLETCSDCPHRDHKGAFGNPSCAPCCRHPAARREDGILLRAEASPRSAWNLKESWA